MGVQRVIRFPRQTDAGVIEHEVVRYPSEAHNDSCFPKQKLEDGWRWHVWDLDNDCWIDPSAWANRSDYGWTEDEAAIVAIQIIEDRFGIDYE